MLRRLIFEPRSALRLLPGASPRAASSADVQTTWQLLDYLAVDYGGAVQDGKVVSASEYAEMREFSASAADKIAGLPANPAKAQLVAESKRFKALIDAQGQSDRTWRLPRTRWASICSPPIRSRSAPGRRRTSPAASSCSRRIARPAMARNGDAQTAMARQLDPPPIAFADRERARQRSAVRPVPGDQPGARGHGDAELRAAARRRQMGARLPRRPLRLSRCARPPRQVRSGTRDPALRAAIPDLNALSALVRKPARGADRRRQGRPR